MPSPQLRLAIQSSSSSTATCPDKNLAKAIFTHDKRIAEHQGYISDMSLRRQHVPNWDALSKQHQDGLLYHWGQDIQRHEAYKSIAEGILRSRQ